MFSYIPFLLLISNLIGCGTETISTQHQTTGHPIWHSDLSDEPQTQIIAHRGFSARAPENTLAAISSALAAQVHMIEFDVRTSSDQKLFLMHDRRLDRTTNADEAFGLAGAAIEQIDSELLQSLDAGFWFHRKFNNEKIPSMQEACDLASDSSMALVEQKSGSAKQYFDHLEWVDHRQRIIIQSFNWKFLQELRKLTPDQNLVPLGKGKITDQHLDFFAEIQATAVHWHHAYLTENVIDTLHQSGLKVWAYTVNSKLRANKLRAIGVDAITTDNPLGI